MKSVNVHEAKTHFSALLKKVEAGEEIVIAKAGKPIARLVPTHGPDERRLGFALGLGPVRIADDFDEYIPEEWRPYSE